MVTLPTFTLFGSFEPAPGFFAVGSPATFLSKTLVGGVFRIMLKLRSEYTVRTTGMIMSLPCVLALNSLQNAMMLMPCGPRAGPTGGAGLALPAASCSLTIPETFFAMTVPSLLREPDDVPGRSVRYEPRGLDPLLHLTEFE